MMKMNTPHRKVLTYAEVTMLMIKNAQAKLEAQATCNAQKEPRFHENPGADIQKLQISFKAALKLDKKEHCLSENLLQEEFERTAAKTVINFIERIEFSEILFMSSKQLHKTRTDREKTKEPFGILFYNSSCNQILDATDIIDDETKTPYSFAAYDVSRYLVLSRDLTKSSAATTEKNIHQTHSAPGNKQFPSVKKPHQSENQTNANIEVKIPTERPQNSVLITTQPFLGSSGHADVKSEGHQNLEKLKMFSEVGERKTTGLVKALVHKYEHISTQMLQNIYNEASKTTFAINSKPLSMRTILTANLEKNIKGEEKRFYAQEADHDTLKKWNLKKTSTISSESSLVPTSFQLSFPKIGTKKVLMSICFEGAVENFTDKIVKRADYCESSLQEQSIKKYRKQKIDDKAICIEPMHSNKRHVQASLFVGPAGEKLDTHIAKFSMKNKISIWTAIRFKPKHGKKNSQQIEREFSPCAMERKSQKATRNFARPLGRSFHVWVWLKQNLIQLVRPAAMP